MSETTTAGKLKKSRTKTPVKTEASDEVSVSIVLGDRDALGNFAAFIDNKPRYVYRESAGVWKSIGSDGRRKLGPKMCARLEHIYEDKIAGLPTIENLSTLQASDEDLKALGRVVLQVWTDSGVALDKKDAWTAIEVNSLSLIQALTTELANALTR